jgi:pyruvate/2-oxoglutarate/acetoin dehydrogenase E1 component
MTEINTDITYKGELIRAMTWLGEQPDTLFIGQAIEYAGTGMTTTLEKVPKEKLLELPVCEDLQTGMSIGLALDNKIVPISIYPRWNFLLLGVNQLVNHLDKIQLMADKPYKPKVIIRTSIGSINPLHPQHQHVGDYTEVFKKMCPHINVVRLDYKETIFNAYVDAYKREGSTILVEWGDAYDANWLYDKEGKEYNSKL